MPNHAYSFYGREFGCRSLLQNHVKIHNNVIDKILQEISEEMEEEKEELNYNKQLGEAAIEE
ncbi:2001_t:CDS:2, partial [Funneliformis mosseae]